MEPSVAEYHGEAEVVVRTPHDGDIRVHIESGQTIAEVRRGLREVPWIAALPSFRLSFQGILVSDTTAVCTRRLRLDLQLPPASHPACPPPDDDDDGAAPTEATQSTGSDSSSAMLEAGEVPSPEAWEAMAEHIQRRSLHTIESSAVLGEISEVEEVEPMGARSVVARAPSQKRTSIYAMDSTVGNGDDIARAEDLEEPGGRAQRFRRSLQLLDAPVDTTRAESNMQSVDTGMPAPPRAPHYRIASSMGGEADDMWSMDWADVRPRRLSVCDGRRVDAPADADGLQAGAAKAEPVVLTLGGKVRVRSSRAGGVWMDGVVVGLEGRAEGVEAVQVELGVGAMRCKRTIDTRDPHLEILPAGASARAGRPTYIAQSAEMAAPQAHLKQGKE